MTLLAQVRGFPAPVGPLDLDVHVGDVILLRGPNGSGKTSLLRSLAGLDAPLCPRAALVGERDARGLSAPELARALALAPQDARDALVGLTVEGEARLRGARLPQPLRAFASREAATLSAGEARRVSLALARGRPILLLDEPSEGLDEDGRARLRDAVQAAAREGAVVAATHDEALEGLATRTIALGAETADAPWRFAPPRGDGSKVEAPAATIRGRALPAVRLAAGLHALVGPNGAGKSTLLLRLAGILDADGVRIAGRAPRAGANVRLATAHARDHLHRERVEEELSGADEAIARALVPDAWRARHPFALSGGEAQRVSLAKCLGRDSAAYLLDEPEAHLDASGRAALARVLARRLDEGACIVVATHDAGVARAAHSVLRLGAA